MSAPSPSPSGLSWHVPGPSSRYHKRQAALPTKQTRFATTSEPGHLTRSQSSTSVRPSPHLPASSSASQGNLWANRSRSSTMDRDGPLTPIRSPRHNATIINDSPFSDYFTDEARSVDDKATYNMPSPETQRLLLRLNNLGAHILRQDPTSSAMGALGRRLDDLENALNAPESADQQTNHMTDSGICMEESTNSLPKSGTNQKLVQSIPESTEEDYEDDMADLRQLKKEKLQDRLLKEVQSVLERVTDANTNLQKRFEEMNDLNDEYAFQVEDSAREVLGLKSENETLKADLAFDHSELLFLKLQMRGLEVQADELLGNPPDIGPEQKQRIALTDDMQKWKADWDDVDARFRGRRHTHGVSPSSPTQYINRREDGKSADDQGDWKLDMCKKHKGRVQSITIKRMDSISFDSTDKELPAEDSDAVSNHSNLYSEQGTQTESLETSGGIEPAKVNAIIEHDSEADAIPQRRRKTPWQLLWDELDAFVGMEDRL